MVIDRDLRGVGVVKFKTVSDGFPLMTLFPSSVVYTVMVV